jgi:hypothetical protein
MAAIGDTVRIYSRSIWNERTDDGRIVLRRARSLHPGPELFVIVGENRHGDWTVSPTGDRRCTHDVLRDDVEPIR